MAIQSSFPKVADQIINFNKNVVDILSKINTLTTSSDPSVTVNILDPSGVAREFNLPTVGFLKSEIDRLNNNINSIYSINEAGALIQPVNGTKFKKVVTVDLNREPNDIGDLNLVTFFKSGKNWFFDSLLNPQIFVEIDLSNKVENNVRKILCRRYITEFERDSDGNFTVNGQKALDSFNLLFRNKNDFTLEAYLSWHETTAGVLNQFNPNYDEQMFDLEPNIVEFDGTFTVLKVEEDTLNKKLFYHLNSLTYVKNQVDQNSEIIQQEKELAVGDEMIINTPASYTRYKILEISKTAQNPRVRFERVEGNQPIPSGVVGVLKVYSPVIYNKRVKISVGFDERNVTFIKALNMENYILSKNWSSGIGYYTNDLYEFDSRQSLPDYYNTTINDYGEVLKDLVRKKTPNSVASKPNSPVLDTGDFKVLQINKHQTDSPDGLRLRDLSNQQKTLQSEIQQLLAAIEEKRKQSKLTAFASDSTRAQFENEIQLLNKKYESKQKLSNSINTQILTLSNSLSTKIEPVYRVRGFFPFPDPVIRAGGKVQEIVQFKIQYRYLSKNGQESPIETFKLNSGTNNSELAAFSNWSEHLSNLRKRSFNKSTGQYSWDTEDITNPDVPNINQVDIPIKINEKVEIRIKSISEVGYPESPVESDWSDSVFVEFPDELATVATQNDAIKQEAQKEELQVAVRNDLTSLGVDTHLSEQLKIGNITYYHTTERILSGFRDSNNNPMDLFTYLQTLQDKLKALEDKVNRVAGELEISIIRNSEVFIVKNGSEIAFNVELEDYLDFYQAPGVPSGRVYTNSIYVVKDFLLKIRNKSTESSLGLLSNRVYNSSTNAAVYSAAAPQVFWVDEQDQLLLSNASGITKTQLDNQFIWCVNYDGLNQNTVTKLGTNVGNDFLLQQNNTLVKPLSTNEYNIGFSGVSILSFVGNNLSLLDRSKWIDPFPSISSTTKLLTTIHPRISSLEEIQETNADKVSYLDGGAENDINIPLNIYFKMNAMDNSKPGLNYEYVNLNGIKTTVKHVKKLKFLLENESDNKPFIFTVKFTLNRAKLIVKKTIESTPVATISNR
jgi:hypothetical protein